MKQYQLLVNVGFISIALSGCLNDNNDPTEPTIEEPTELEQVTEQLNQLVQSKNLTALQAPENVPAVTDPLVQLGKKLFFTKALSGNMDTACASCHHPNLGGGDDLPLSIGVEASDFDLLGPGRLHNVNGEHFDGGPTVPRNAPSTFNIAFYHTTIFHDGRIENLVTPPSTSDISDSISTPDSGFQIIDTNAQASLAATQARFPVTSKEEMRGFSYVAGGSNDELREQLAQRLQGNTDDLGANGWLEQFQIGFEQPNGSAQELITGANIFTALGEYERSQILVNSPWNDFLSGNGDTLSLSAKRGALLFYQDASQGGFDCASCHSGSFLTDESFHVIAIPQVGRGKGDGPNGDDDFGRFKVTHNDQDMYAYRTPHLTNITQTGPYGHSGAYATLEQVIEHHLNPEQAIANYDPSAIQTGIQTEHWQQNTMAALTKLQQQQTDGSSKLQTFSYTEQNIADLVSFLQSLEDPCTVDTACMNQWVPASDEVDPDGKRLVAYDQNGDLL